MTNRDRANELWLLFLSGRRLEAREESELFETLKGDPEFRHMLLKDADMDGLLRGAGWSTEDGDAFVQHFSESLSAEDATRFIRKVESQLEKEPTNPPRGGLPGMGGPTSSPRRSPFPSHRARPEPPTPSLGPWSWALVAAGVLIALTIFLGLGSPGPDRAASQYSAEGRSRATNEAEGRRPAERKRTEGETGLTLAETKDHEAIERLEIEKRRQALLKAESEPKRVPGEGDILRKDLQTDQERVKQVEREMRDAIELAQKNGRPVPTEQPKDEKRPPQEEFPAVKPELTTQMVVARVEEATGQAFFVTKAGKTPVTSGGNLLPMQGLETGGGASRLVLRFPDKTRVEMGPETELGEIKIDPGKRLWVAKGTVRGEVASQRKDQPMIFATPQGEARVLGTKLRIVVDFDPKKGTRLEVEEGKVELKNLAGRAVLVEGGHFAVAAEGVDFASRKQDTPANPPRSGLSIWLRADQGVVPSGTGGVAAWADASGNKHDAIQGTPVQQPTLVPNSIQGYPALRFDGVDDCMTFPCPVTGLTGMTIFLVSSTLEERGATTHAANAALYWQESATCSGVALNPSQSKVWCYFGTGQVQPLFLYSRPTSIDRGFSLTTAQKSGTEVILFVNGLETLRIRGQKPVIGANEKFGQIGRGEGDLLTNRQFQGQREGWTYFSGEIAELLVYTRTLGEAERKSVEQYLLGKYFPK